MSLHRFLVQDENAKSTYVLLGELHLKVKVYQNGSFYKLKPNEMLILQFKFVFKCLNLNA